MHTKTKISNIFSKVKFGFHCNYNISYIGPSLNLVLKQAHHSYVSFSFIYFYPCYCIWFDNPHLLITCLAQCICNHLIHPMGTFFICVHMIFLSLSLLNWIFHVGNKTHAYFFIVNLLKFSHHQMTSQCLRTSLNIMKFLLVDGVIYNLNPFPCAIFTCGVTI